MLTNPHHTTDVLKLFRRVVLLGVIVPCPRSFGIPMSSLSPARGAKRSSCSDCAVEGDKPRDFHSFFTLLDCPKTSLRLGYLGKRGRKLRDKIPASNYFT